MKNSIRSLRLARGWGQEELATKLGVSRQTIYALEYGRFDPSLPLAFKMAAVFGLRIEDIWDPVGDAE
ncbi:MAG: helix-turn-helix transcriptional regulator [Gemmatimonadales bacterium]